MTRTLIDIDDVALAAAAKELGTKTKVDTVNQALADIAGRADRMAAIEYLLTRTDDLGDQELMNSAWE